MKEIILTNGEIALVSDEDYDYLNQWTWRRTSNSIYRSSNGAMIALHLEIAKRLGLDTSQEIDHKDTNRLNNQRTNLRVATRSQNQANAKLSKKSSSGYKGVCFDKRSNKWQASIQVKGVRMTLGYFIEPEDAARAYDKAARKFQGEFARCNFNESD
jgi:hypothetical protein